MPTEICLLEMCRGTPGVVRLIDWFANSKGFLIVMERPEEFMDLFDLISIYGSLSEMIARSIFIQIVNTVCCLYADHGVFHRDIKDENIIVNMRTGEVVLVDFGAAALISKTDTKKFQGTRSYCPPEWFKRVTYMPMEATVWSLGIVLYVLVTGSLPFRNEIQICLGRLTIPKRISEDCEHLIRRCLAVTPERRADLIELRQHRWLCQPITVHSEPFKCVLDRKLSKRLFAYRRVKRGSFTGAISNDDTELLSDSQTDASIDVCERIRRASSADVTIDVDNDITYEFFSSPMVQRRVIERNSMESDQKIRCFSNYDNLSMDAPIDVFNFVGYDNVYDGAEEKNDYRLSVDTDQLSRDISTSQYYSAQESLGFGVDESNPSAVCCCINADGSRCLDTDSLQDVAPLECNDGPTTSAVVHQNPFGSSSHPYDINTNDVVFDNPSFEAGKEEYDANATKETANGEDEKRKSIDRGVSPSLSRHRPLTVQRSDIENCGHPFTSLSIFRVDSRKYAKLSKQPIAV
ncbi:unnamed protein product [Toxocara canis]|uniref:Serine/threonine-protein kinase 1 n=1 Tax=Toxocara canis TaxID=6265 RepID=A0A183V101_TOXCA|nr:unnamed protein product [Toxocara canis]